MENKNIVYFEFLKSYFNMFDATIKNLNLIDKDYYGTAIWQEDDFQESCWHINTEATHLPIIKSLCDFLKNNNMLSIDQIKITPNELFSKLIDSGWNEYSIESYIDLLFNIDIRMIDDGIETDGFFIHF
jgi:hypothetical protein